LAREQGRTTTQVAAAAIDLYVRDQFFLGLNEDYARLQADPAARADGRAEVMSLEGTLLDGREDDPWTEQSHCG
jgi:hypothetical protein